MESKKFLHAAFAAAALLSPGGVRLFAGPFIQDAPISAPTSGVYDKESQLTVSPSTGKATYSLQDTSTIKTEWTAIVTPGPTGDGKWDSYHD